MTQPPEVWKNLLETQVCSFPVLFQGLPPDPGGTSPALGAKGPDPCCPRQLLSGLRSLACWGNSPITPSSWGRGWRVSGESPLKCFWRSRPGVGGRAGEGQVGFPRVCLEGTNYLLRLKLATQWDLGLGN